jgi:hypothetical protein
LDGSDLSHEQQSQVCPAFVFGFIFWIFIYIYFFLWIYLFCCPCSNFFALIIRFNNCTKTHIRILSEETRWLKEKTNSRNWIRRTSEIMRPWAPAVITWIARIFKKMTRIPGSVSLILHSWYLEICLIIYNCT